MQLRHRQVIAAVDVARIRMHDIRHTYATMERHAGVHPEVVSDRLKHASIATTLDIKTHVSVDLQDVTARALARRLFSDAGDATTSSAGREARNRFRAPQLCSLRGFGPLSASS